MAKRYEIKTFDGDLSALSLMINNSWLKDVGRSVFFNYNEGLLNWYLNGPSSDKEGLVGAYKDGELVGFVCGMPRTMSYKGKNLKGVIGTLLTTHADYRRMRVSADLVSKSIKRAILLRYDVLFGFLFSKRASSYLVKPFEKHNAMPQILQTTTLFKMLNTEKLSEMLGENKSINLHQKTMPENNPENTVSIDIPYEGEVREYKKDDLDDVLKLYNSIKSKVPLARVWSKEELSWHLDHPPISKTMVLDDNGIKGAINFYMAEGVGLMMGKRTMSMTGEIDNVYLPDDENGSIALINGTIDKIKSLGGVGASLFNTNYFDLKPFRKSGFLSTPRKLGFYGQALNHRSQIPALEKCYIDLR